MNPERHPTEPLTIRDYAQVLRRRKWTILAVVAVGVLVGTGLSIQDPPRYGASAKVLIGIGTPPRNAAQRVAPDRLNETNAALGKSTALARETLVSARIFDRSPDKFLASSAVKSNPQNDILTFRVSDASRKNAVVLVNEYARSFIRARRRIDGGKYVSQVGEAHLVAPATRAAQTDPEVKRDLILGLALGLILGILAAFLRDSLDTRIRSSAAVLSRLGLPLLGRLPTPPRSYLRALSRFIPPLRARAQRDAVTMLAQPNGRHAEPFRVLRTNLDFFNMEHGARSMMITSAMPDEGKSTTTANLAVALARTGRRVIVVDMDLRRPSLHQLFGRYRQPGVVESIMGRVELDAALVPVDIRTPVAGGELHLLPAGASPASIGEFFTSPALGIFMRRLAERADIVLIDGPPLLGTSDAVTIAAEIDALAVVARVGETSDPILSDLRRVLEICRAEKLGVILTGVPSGDAYPSTSETEDAAPVPMVTPVDAADDRWS